MTENQQIRKEDVKIVFDSPYIKVADLQYAPGRHYFDATRRVQEELVAVKSDEEFRKMQPDAVSCIVILHSPGQEAKLLLSYEFRYPTGRYLLSVPAGLIDPDDRDEEEPILSATVREIREETGLQVEEGDSVTVVNPLLFSTPGMTDESNALVCAVLRNAKLTSLSQEGAVGSEQFDGFALLTKDAAREALRKGRDERGNYYSVYTWAALAYFVSDAWKEE
ncbi:MAG: NUDIX hydrolase [Lachnospiraceae bacterium]|jgi:ADP-ribose pyrophosphatase|nr:NUDIX hydrolase [Lachnospiraceae bacterium]